MKHAEITLSKREIQVLKMICQEYETKVIAKKLSLSESGVEYHRKTLYKKIKAKSIIGLFKFALKNKIVKI